MKNRFIVFSNYLKWRWEKFVDWKGFAHWWSQKENERQFREAMRLQHEREKAAKKFEQDNCPHRAGCSALSENCSTLTSIVWHITDTGVVVGICTNCQREFWPTDKDYTEWRKKRSINTLSAAGQRLGFVGNDAQQQISDLPETEDSVPSYTQDELYRQLERERSVSGTYAIPAEGLDSLSDQAIKDLMDGVRELRRKEKGLPEDDDYEDDYDIGDE